VSEQELRILVRQLQEVIRWGDGVPSADPRVPRAIYVDRTGALGSVVYVWDGSSWSAFA
jgi:hypothetical protein